ncbi:MAG: hypothetical protein ACOX52_16605 [Verrucomicrobiota bacterium]
MDSSSGNGRPHKMNRQDAKDAKEIENLEKFVIGAYIGYELQESTGLAGARPERCPQKLGPESYTMMRLVRVRVRRVAISRKPGRNRNRNRDRDRFLF